MPTAARSTTGSSQAATSKHNAISRNDSSVEPPRRWSKEEEEFLIASHRILTNQQIADRLGKTRETIRSKIKYLRISGQSGASREWSEAEETYLLLAWQTDLLREIAAALGRSVPAVRIRAKYVLKIRRPPSYYASHAQAHRLLPAELREVMTLNRKLKKGLIDAEHRRPAGAPIQGAGSAAR